MRIAFAKPRRSVGGGTRMALRLGESLAARGHDLLLLCHPASRVGDEWRELGLEAAPVLAGRDLRALPIARAWWTLRWFEPDVMLAFMAWPHDLGLFMPAPTRLGIPLVVRCGLAGVFASAGRDEAHLRAASGFIAVSESIGREIAGALPGLEAPVKVIPNGVDVDAFAAARPADLELPAGAVAVGFVGRLHEEKGLLDLAAAWPQVEAAVPAAHLVVAGEGPDEERVRVDFAASERVRFLGFRSDTTALHRALDLLVLPSHREGFSNAIVEAMAAGTPVVATNVAGAVEAVEDGESGLLVPPRDADALAAALVRLATDEEERRRLGARATERARERYAWSRVLAAYEAELRAAAVGSTASVPAG